MSAEREYTPPITLDNGGIELDTTPDSGGDLELTTTVEDMHVGYLRPADQIALRDLMLRLHPLEPRQVTTVEELDALPEGSVVMGPWATYQLVLGDWATLGGPGSATVELPATVLHVGGAE